MEEPDQKDSVESAKYKIQILLYLYSLDVFYGSGFSGLDPDFWPIRILTQKKNSIWIRKKLDLKHCFFPESVPGLAKNPDPIWRILTHEIFFPKTVSTVEGQQIVTSY